MPVGIWHRTSINPAEIHKKDIVLFCLSLENEAGKFAIEQGYFARGSCPGNIAPLLKPIIAESGDIINLTTEFVAINGKQIINSQTYSYDSSGMRLSVFPRGKYVVKTGEFWVIGSEHDRSFDSRYFGAIKANQIIGIMNLVWLWN
jgi:conjugative transfer signal peptidase TraF